MKKIFFSLSLLFLAVFTAGAQNELDINHLMDGTYRIKTNVKDAKFIGSSDRFSYLDGQWKMWEADAKGNAKEVSYDGLSAGELYSRVYLSDDEFAYTKEGKVFIYNTKTKSSREWVSMTSSPMQACEINYKSGNAAWVENNNIFVNQPGKTAKQITFDGDSLNIIYGQSVHRNEFGINGGLFFSADGNVLAYYRMDQSMVGNYPLVNTEAREAQVNNIKYPMAGMKSHEVLVYVYDFQSGRNIMLQTRKDTSVAEREMYLTNIALSPDGSKVYIQKLNRLQNHMWMEVYNTSDGKLDKVLFEETSGKYFEPENPIYFLSNDPSKFIYLSERDGWMHMYLYSTDGKMIKQLTSGKWMVNEFVCFNDKCTEAFFYATKDSPLQKNLYGVNLKNGKITRYTPEHGTHNVAINAKGTLFVDSYSSTETAYRTALYNNKQKLVKELDNAADPFDSLSNKPIITIDSLYSADGTMFYTRMIKPKDFDPNKKYPVIVYVYGGPHAQLITDYWTAGAGNFLPYLATKGYIVWTLDSRGSANRGYEFESAIWHQCGTQEISDQMEGIKYLKALPFVDSTRIGVDGWSYGGFMTLGLTLRNPGTFKVSTAGGPVIDWKWYEVMYGERYMGTPENNPEGYKTASLLNYIDNIQSKILIFQGYQDNTVVPQHSLEFIRQCVAKKKPVDYFMYTAHEHNVRGTDRTELYKKIYQYYEDYLKK